MLEDKLIKIMQTHDNLKRDLELVQQLNLQDWCISAGYVRNYVWDYLHGYTSPTPLNDVDVLYYDPTDLREKTEKKYEMILKNKQSEYNWSCKNQARMHLRNQDPPYVSVADAMRRWPETVTAVGIRFDKDRKIEIVAPFGLNDLFELRIRKSPYFRDEDFFISRVLSKKWLETWPQLKLDRSEGAK